MRRAARRRSKYGNVRVTVDGYQFASKAEARHYAYLRVQEKAGVIHNLTLQRPFPLAVNGVSIGSYVSDFTYTELPSGRYVVVDVKGVKTAVYRLKAKLVKALYGITITEVNSRKVRR